MPEILLAVLTLVTSPSFTAQLTAKEEESPHALIVFVPELAPKEWTTTFEMTTVSGACYEVSLHCIRESRYDLDAIRELLEAKWIAKLEFGSIRIRVYGARTPGGQTDAVRSLKLINRLVDGKGVVPNVSSVGGVKVEVRTDDGKAKPMMERRLRPTGPDIRERSYVEFDFSTLPSGSGDEVVRLAAGMQFVSGDTGPEITVLTGVHVMRPFEVAEGILESFLEYGCKAEIVGKTRLRVYGCVKGSRFCPALKGSVESEDLKPDQLPRVINARS